MLLLAALAVAHAAPLLDVTGSCPGPMDLHATGLMPGAPVALVRGTGPGSTTIPSGPCAGTPIGLASPTLVQLTAASSFGASTWSPTLASPSCGLWLAVVDLQTCQVSPAAPVRPAVTPWQLEYDLVFNGDASFIDAEPVRGGWALAVETADRGPLLLSIDDLGAARGAVALPMYSVDALAPAADGGWLLAGSKDDFANPAVVKIAADGTLAWTRSWEDTSVYPGFYGADVAPDGSFLVAGAFEMALSPAGIAQWTGQHVGGQGSVFSVEAAPNGWLLAGTWAADIYNGPSDVTVTRLDSAGQTTWNRSYSGSDWDWGDAAKPTSDGGSIITGWTYSFSPDRGCFLTKLNGAGDVVWSKVYTMAYEVSCFQVEPTADGGYVATGWTELTDGVADLLVFKTGATGNVEWSYTYGPGGGSVVRQASDGGFFIAGWTGAWPTLTVRAVRTDASGRTGCEHVATLTQADAPFVVSAHAVQAPPTPAEGSLPGGLVAESFDGLPVCQ